MDDQIQLGEECKRYRQAFDECRDDAWADEHKRQCQPCCTWVTQSIQIVQLTAEMPQFDVPEALTQRILTAVELEKNVARTAMPIYVWPSAALIAGVMLTALPYESAEGLLSWGCGLMALVVVKFLVCGNKPATESSAG